MQFGCCVQKLLRVEVSLVDILIIPPSIAPVDVLTVLSPTVLYEAKRAVSLLGMSTLSRPLLIHMNEVCKGILLYPSAILL